MSSDDQQHDQDAEETNQRMPDDPISQQLRQAYQSVASEPLPTELASLLERLKQAPRK